MILEGFWEGFGRVWETKLDQKINKKSIWKDDEIFGGILEASWWHLGGILETFGGIWRLIKIKRSDQYRLEAVGGWAVGSMRGTLSICVCIQCNDLTRHGTPAEDRGRRI